MPPPETTQPTLAAEEETPFTQWGAVLENLMSACPPLYGVLAQSQAVLKGNLLLICTDNAMFKELLEQGSNKKMLMQAITQATGTTYRVGLRRAVKVKKEEQDPLSQLLTAARNADVTVQEN